MERLTMSSINVSIAVEVSNFVRVDEYHTTKPLGGSTARPPLCPLNRSRLHFADLTLELPKKTNIADPTQIQIKYIPRFPGDHRPSIPACYSEPRHSSHNPTLLRRPSLSLQRCQRPICRQSSCLNALIEGLSNRAVHSHILDLLSSPIPVLWSGQIDLEPITCKPENRFQFAPSGHPWVITRQAGVRENENAN